MMLRGEVWLINLDPTFGPEIRKTRPAAIVSNDSTGALPLKVIMSITEWQERFTIAPWLVRIVPSPDNGPDKVPAADAFQVRSVAQQRFVRRLGRLITAQMVEIVPALTTVLAIES